LRVKTRTERLEIGDEVGKKVVLLYFYPKTIHRVVPKKPAVFAIASQI